jgi:hypothetical protein
LISVGYIITHNTNGLLLLGSEVGLHSNELTDLCSSAAGILTTASESICVEAISSVAYAAIRPREVDTLVLAAMARRITFINVYIRD